MTIHSWVVFVIKMWYIESMSSAKKIRWGKRANVLICYFCQITNVPLMKHSKNKNGGQYYQCRPCNTARLQKYRKTKEGRQKTNEAVYRSTKKYQYKQNARAVLNYNLRLGLIKKPKVCSICGEEKRLEAHHEDYTKPLGVKWLCRQCHFDIHKSVVE